MGWWEEHKIIRRLTKILGCMIVAFILLIVGLIILIGTPFFSAKLGDVLTSHSGRKISVGHVETYLWSAEPRFILSDVQIGNADWADTPSMFSANRIEFSLRPIELLHLRLVIPKLIADAPVLDLEKMAENKTNWNFSQNPDAAAVKAAVPEKRSSFPVISELRITNGKLRYLDALKHTDTTLDVSTISGGEGSENRLKLMGKGTYQKEPFTLDLSGGSIIALRESSEPYPFMLKTKMGKTEIEAKGTAKDPIKMEALDIHLNIKGANAADLFELTGIALPPTPSYQLEGHLTNEDKIWYFKHFKGRMGNSDLRGNLEWHADAKPHYFKGDFISNSLDMKDLGGLIGAHRHPADETRVLPDAPLDITKLEAMNADVTFTSESIKVPDLLDDFTMKLSLKDKVLTVKPLSFGIAKGKINAKLVVDGNKTPPFTSLDVDFHRLSLTSLFKPLADKFGENNVSAGLIGGKAAFKGTGKSLREMLGSSNGEMGVGMEGGQLSKLLLELIGLDIFKAAGLTLTGDKPITIDCIVGDFSVKDGLMEPKAFLIDTDVSTIQGTGDVNLKDEAINLRLNASPKNPSLLSARSPILIGGHLKKPSVGVDPVALAARGGVAAVLGVLLTPIGALLAFVEPGLGKDSNCASFLRQMDHKTGGEIPHQAGASQKTHH